MKKIGLLVVGGIALFIFFANLAPMVALAISLLVAYYSFKQFMKAEKTMGKIIWMVIGLIALSASASNFPAVIGVAAIYVLYLVYKKWNGNKPSFVEDQDDPFTNFEKQWAEIKRNY